MADLSVIKLLGATYKTASKSALASKGYPDGRGVRQPVGRDAHLPHAVRRFRLQLQRQLRGQRQLRRRSRRRQLLQSDGGRSVQSGSSATLTMHEKTDGVLDADPVLLRLRGQEWHRQDQRGRQEDADRHLQPHDALWHQVQSRHPASSYVKVTKYHTTGAAPPAPRTTTS